MAAPHRPSPEPLQTDDLRVVLAGTALWIGLLAVLLLRGLTANDVLWRWVWVCVAGVFLGAVGIRQVRRRKRSSGSEHKPPTTPKRRS